MNIYTIGTDTLAFRLTLPAYFRMQEALDGGMEGALTRIYSETHKSIDLSTIVAHGLCGAGMDAAVAHKKAKALVMRHARQCAEVCIQMITGAFEHLAEKQALPSASKSEKPFDIAMLYQQGFQLGLKPWEVDRLTPWEFAQCVEGFNRANGNEEAEPPPVGEIRRLAALYG